MNSTPLLLQYSTLKPRRVLRYAVFALLLASAVYGAWKAASIIPRLRLLYAQSQCIALGKTVSTREKENEVAESFEKLLSPLDPSQHLASMGGDFVFVGRLRNSLGDRIVLIQCEPEVDLLKKPLTLISTSGGTFRAVVIEPGTWLKSPRFNYRQCTRTWFALEAGNIDSVTVYPPSSLTTTVGRSDPKDPRRFFIPYQIGNRQGLFAGTLSDDDTVEFEDESVQVSGNFTVK